MYGECENCRCETGLGIALAPVTGAISAIGSLFGGTRPTGGAVYREDGARWSAAKKYWEKPPSTKASQQSPAPSGPSQYCTWDVACLQKTGGGAVDPLVFIPKGCDFYRQGYACTQPGPSLAAAQATQSSKTPPVSPGGYPQTVTTAGVGGPVLAGLSTGPLLIAGLAAAAIFALSRK